MPWQSVWNHWLQASQHTPGVSQVTGWWQAPQKYNLSSVVLLETEFSESAMLQQALVQSHHVTILPGATTPWNCQGANTPRNCSGATTPSNWLGAITPRNKSGATTPCNWLNWVRPHHVTYKVQPHRVTDWRGAITPNNWLGATTPCNYSDSHFTPHNVLQVLRWYNSLTGVLSQNCPTQDQGNLF